VSINRVNASEKNSGSDASGSAGALNAQDAPLPGSTDGSADGSMDGAFGAGGFGSVKRRISSGSLLMGGVVVLSIGSLWSMRAIDRAAASGPLKSSEMDVFVDEALERGGRKVDPNTDATRLLEPTEANADLRVPWKDLVKNPFLIWLDPTVPGTTDPKDPPTTPGDDLAARIAAWQKQVDAAAAAIRLQSTIVNTSGPKGATGIANINGHMLRLDDVFGVDGTDTEFKIQSIDRDEMTVVAYNAALKHERIVKVTVLKKKY